MENLKKGDTVVINAGFTYHFRRGDKFTIDSVSEKTALLNVKINFHKGNFKKIGESQMQYEESNCYKLKQAIKKTGISSEKLSLATTKGKTKYHFYSYTKKSRLTDRGDISDARLNKLLTDLRHAEREVLGIGAKTVEEPSDAEIQMVDLASAVEEKPKSNKPLFIGASVVIFIAIILFILNNYLQVV